MPGQFIQVLYKTGDCKVTEIDNAPLAIAGQLKFMSFPGTYSSPDFNGTSMSAGVRASHEPTSDASADWQYEGQQTFDGTVLGKKGTFLASQQLKHSGGKFVSHWEIVAGSGRGELEGISGQGSFDGIEDGVNPVKGMFNITL